MKTVMPKPVSYKHTQEQNSIRVFSTINHNFTINVQTSHPPCEQVNRPDSVPSGLQSMCVHQAVVIATGLVFFCVKTMYNTDTRHCLICSLIRLSDGVLHCEGQPLRREETEGATHFDLR